MGSCILGGGTLGGFPPKTFPISVINLERAMDSLFRVNPQYKIPAKWQGRDSWSDRGFGFLNSRIFYFSQDPEEMYYVTFIGDENMDKLNTATIAIRAVDSSTENWLTCDELNEHRQKEITNRFQTEIITKLESYSGTKSYDGY